MAVKRLYGGGSCPANASSTVIGEAWLGSRRGRNAATRTPGQAVACRPRVDNRRRLEQGFNLTGTRAMSARQNFVDNKVWETERAGKQRRHDQAASPRRCNRLTIDFVGVELGEAGWGARP